jgi:ClpP class serine protease
MFTGEIWQAKEALGNGLIDGIQNIETTLAMFDQQSFDGKKASMLAQIDIALDQLEN